MLIDVSLYVKLKFFSMDIYIYMRNYGGGKKFLGVTYSGVIFAEPRDTRKHSRSLVDLNIAGIASLFGNEML